MLEKKREILEKVEKVLGLLKELNTDLFEFLYENADMDLAQLHETVNCFKFTLEYHKREIEGTVFFKELEKGE